MRIEVVFESDIKILQIKMTSVNCLIYCFDAITGQALQIERVTSKFFKICRHRYFHRNLKITKKQRQQNLFHQKIKYEEQYEIPQRACER